MTIGTGGCGDERDDLANALNRLAGVDGQRGAGRNAQAGGAVADEAGGVELDGAVAGQLGNAGVEGQRRRHARSVGIDNDRAVIHDAAAAGVVHREIATGDQTEGAAADGQRQVRAVDPGRTGDGGVLRRGQAAAGKLGGAGELQSGAGGRQADRQSSQE